MLRRRPHGSGRRTALAIGSYSYRSVESILQHRLDTTAARSFERADPVEHGNIRGALYYQ